MKGTFTCPMNGYWFGIEMITHTTHCVCDKSQDFQETVEASACENWGFILYRQQTDRQR